MRSKKQSTCIYCHKPLEQHEEHGWVHADGGSHNVYCLDCNWTGSSYQPPPECPECGFPGVRVHPKPETLGALEDEFKLKWYRKIPIDNIIASIVLGSLFAFLIWQGTGIQKIVTPRRYWQRQVENLEHDIELSRQVLKGARHDIPLQMEELPTGIEQYYDSLVIAGWDSTDAQKAASSLEEATLTMLRIGLEIATKLFLEDSLALEEAKRKLPRLED